MIMQARAQGRLDHRGRSRAAAGCRRAEAAEAQTAETEPHDRDMMLAAARDDIELDSGPRAARGRERLCVATARSSRSPT